MEVYSRRPAMVTIAYRKAISTAQKTKPRAERNWGFHHFFEGDEGGKGEDERSSETKARTCASVAGLWLLVEFIVSLLLPLPRLLCRLRSLCPRPDRACWR